MEEYDPATDTWMERRNMPTVRAIAADGVVDGKIYIIGGGDAQGALSNVEEYTPEGWQIAPISPQSKLPMTWGEVKQ